MASIVVALGGNALLKPGQKGTLKEQAQNISAAMSHVARLAKQGHKLVITHGNGPQVGSILLQNESSKAPEMPLHVCVAESQGMIGYLIQETLYNQLHKLKLAIPVVTYITQVEVDPRDPAFKEPTKPIGPFYKSRPAFAHVTKTPKGWRRVVASPKPKTILELESIKACTGIAIACGGGGIPVVRKVRGYQGVDAVVDKDLASSLLAQRLRASTLAILTDVPGVYLDYKRPGQRLLKKTTSRELSEYAKQGHFQEGSMLPKIEAATSFARSGGKAVICGLEALEKALLGKAGTIITK